MCAIEVRAVAGKGVRASIPARPVPRKVARWPFAPLVKFLHLFMSTRIKKTAVNQMIAARPGRIAKLREAKKMEGARGGAGGSARQESWQHSKTNTQHWSRFSDPRGMDPRIFLLWKKRISARKSASSCLIRTVDRGNWSQGRKPRISDQHSSSEIACPLLVAGAPRKKNHSNLFSNLYI